MSDIIRWNPFREVAAMQRAMDRAFDNFWGNDWPIQSRWGAFESPALDIHESDNAYNVMIPLPGLAPDQINVRIHNGILTISGELPQPKVADNSKVVVQERSYGTFSRSVSLPQTVDEDKVEASYENGVLNLTLPKVPQAQPKQIPIKSNGKVLSSKN